MVPLRHRILNCEILRNIILFKLKFFFSHYFLSIYFLVCKYNDPLFSYNLALIRRRGSVFGHVKKKKDTTSLLFRTTKVYFLGVQLLKYTTKI